MGRPRKNSAEKTAKERLVDSFWHLLEEHDFSKISVEMLCKEAKCNRGTFYYHFSGMDSLLEYIVESTFISNRYPQMIFSVLTGTGDLPFSSIVESEWPEHTALFTRNGNNVLTEKTKQYILKMWTAILCSDGGQLSDQTRLILEYQSSAMLASLSYLGEESLKGHMISPPIAFFSSVAKTALRQICALEGITEDDLKARITMVGEVSKLMKS
ncbi:MAG: TetR/AcrR family transcriptional regulator [Coriobacteriales bacterium]|jgi:hypothetical protein